MQFKSTFIVLSVAAVLTACGGGTTTNADDTTKNAAEKMAAKTEAMTSAVVPAQAVLAAAPSGNYELDKGHGYINFSYSHLGFSNPTVGFRDFTVELMLDNANVANSTLNVDIDVNSIDSRVEKFDEHLVGEKMFNTAEFPRASFKSTKIEVVSNNQLAVTGDLTIKGITLPVTLDTTINKAAMHPFAKKPTIGVSATTRIDRSKWDLGYASPHVGTDVDINIEIELPQATPSEE